MARHWVQPAPAGSRRPTWTATPPPEDGIAPDAEVPPIVPAARRPDPVETDPAEIDAAEIGPAEIEPAEIGPAETRPVQSAPVRTGPAAVRSTQAASA